MLCLGRPSIFAICVCRPRFSSHQTRSSASKRAISSSGMEICAELCRYILFTGFFFWLLQNGPAFAGDIINSLRQLGGKAAGDGQSIYPGNLITLGMQVVQNAMQHMMGSAQIDVKKSFKGRQPNKESAAKPLCRYVSPATALHTKRNVITLRIPSMKWSRYSVTNA
jgi:hypothetical protein